MDKVIRWFLAAALCLGVLGGCGACAESAETAVYTLTYESGGANGSPPAQRTAAAGETVTLATNPFRKTDYVFSGWSDGAVLWDAGAAFVMPARHVTLRAAWEPAPAAPRELACAALDGETGRVNTDGLPFVGDPFLLYEEEEGVFYLYGTTRMNRYFDGDAGNDGVEEGFRCYSSRDLRSWTDEGMCMTTADSGWAKNRFWAPEVYLLDGRYYMYYTGAPNGEDRALRLSVAVADSPRGPFVDAHTAPVFDVGYKSIDCSLFVDPDDGGLYLYFAKDQLPDPAYGGAAVSSIMGLKLADPSSVDRGFNGGRPVQLLSVGHSSVEDHAYGAERIDQPWEIAERGRYWNEGPFMTKHEGRYYLTYSANNFGTAYYGVGYAVGASPLGGFIKPADAQLIGVDREDYPWTYFAGTGHHMFLEIGGENFVVYHRYLTSSPAVKRAVWIDRWGFDEAGRMYINGPTKTAQPLPAVLSGAENAARDAAVTIDGAARAGASLLRDGAIAVYGKYAGFREYAFGAGTHTVTLTLPSARDVAGVVVYGSTDAAVQPERIDRITFDDGDYIRDVAFAGAGKDPVWIGVNASALLARPVRARRITLSVTAAKAFRLSEIMILARAA